MALLLPATLQGKIVCGKSTLTEISVHCKEVGFTRFPSGRYSTKSPDKKLVDLTTVHWNEHFWHNRVFSSLHLTETTFFVEKHEFSENLIIWAGHHMVFRKTTNEFLVCYLLELQSQKLVHVLLYDIFVRYFWIKILFIF